MKINEIRPQDNKFLQIISDIVLMPTKLYYIGTLPQKRLPTVAIVGTRKPTAYGKEVTSKLANGLASRGVVIVSGLALGVDAIAHRAALDAGGITIAVQANGLSKIYPRSNEMLGRAITENSGAIISEYEPNMPAMAHQFLERNRIVSGLADAIIITEAAIKSGTMSTASHALAQGKEVFVVPGNITSPMSAGCNELIKQGAQPITSIEDVLQIIAPNLKSGQIKLALGDNEAQSKILQLISSGMRDGDEIRIACKIPTNDFLAELTLLEINGSIRNIGANQWVLN